RCSASERPGSGPGRRRTPPSRRFAARGSGVRSSRRSRASPRSGRADGRAVRAGARPRGGCPRVVVGVDASSLLVSLVKEAVVPRLDRITSPHDLRRLSREELPELAHDMRERLIDVVSRVGGHFAPGLGVVELTIALHYIFDTPRDKLV